VIDPFVTPTSVTSSTAASDLRPVDNLINGSGLTSPLNFENYASEEHAPVTGSNSWVTETAGGFVDYYTSRPIPELVFGLAEPTLLTDIVVWGYAGTGEPNRNEAKTFEISFSTDGGASYSSSVTVNHAFTGTMVETISLGGEYLADTVRVRITDNHFLPPGNGGGDRVGLGEVRFLSSVAEFDQRGLPRLVDGDGIGGARLDLGAYELQNTSAADFDSASVWLKHSGRLQLPV